MVVWDMPARLGSVIYALALALPAALAMVLLPSTSGRAALEKWNIAWVCSFLFSTVLSLVLYTHLKLLTVVANSALLPVLLFGLMRIANHSRLQDFRNCLTGIQVGFVLFSAFMLMSGNIVSAHVGVGIIDETFDTTAGVGRNTFTLAAAISLAASLSGLGRRGFHLRWLEIASIALALYSVYIVPGKGAWLSAGFLLAVAGGVLFFSRKWGALGVAGVTFVALVPFLYARLYQYMVAYFMSGAALTFSNRLPLWKAAFVAVHTKHAYLFGFGYGSAFDVASKVFEEPLLHFHNEFVNAFYEGGICGTVLLFGAFFYAMYLSIIKSRRLVMYPEGRVAIFCMLIFFLLFSRLASEVSLTIFNGILPMWFYCSGLLVSRSLRAQEETALLTRRMRLKRAALVTSQ
jgi:O-antigen ligase